MKKLCILIAMVAGTLLTSAQTSPVEKVFEQYAGSEGYTSVHITEYMFRIFATIANEAEEKEFKDITSSLTGIKVLSLDSLTHLERKQQFYKEMVRQLAKPEYKDLMIIQDGKDEIKFVIREKGDMISELVMIGDQFLIVLLGDIDLNQIAKLSKTLDIEGLEHLENVD